MNWNFFSCYLSGQHEFGVRCEPGEIYLRCIHCGRRSPGWEVKGAKPVVTTPSTTVATNPRVAPRKAVASA